MHLLHVDGKLSREFSTMIALYTIINIYRDIFGSRNIRVYFANELLSSYQSVFGTTKLATKGRGIDRNETKGRRLTHRHEIETKER